MTHILSISVAKSANPLCWQCHSSLLSDWLIAVGIATVAIWLALSLICLIVEHRTIAKSMSPLVAGRRWSPTRVFAALISICTSRTVRRQRTAA